MSIYKHQILLITNSSRQFMFNIRDRSNCAKEINRRLQRNICHFVVRLEASKLMHYSYELTADGLDDSKMCNRAEL